MHKKTIFGLAIGWTALVAFLCLVKLGELPTFGVSEADKYVHFTFHFVFTMLWGCYVWLKNPERKLKPIVTIVILSLLYGILIEFMQETCTTTRHADIADVMANLTGAITALIFFVAQKKNAVKNT